MTVTVSKAAPMLSFFRSLFGGQTAQRQVRSSVCLFPPLPHLLEVLQKGVLFVLTQAWNRRTVFARWDRPQRVIQGPIWERHPTTFPSFSLQFLRTFGEAGLRAVSGENVDWTGVRPQLPGDHLLLFLFGANYPGKLPTSPPFTNSPLGSLLHPDPGEADLVGWLSSPEGSLLVEGLQPLLATHVKSVEEHVLAGTDPIVLLRRAQSRAALWNQWLSACDKLKRPDLCHFLVQVWQPPFCPIPTLDGNTTLSVRSKACVAATYGVTVGSRLFAWRGELSRVSAWDPAYPFARAMVTAWIDLTPTWKEQLEGFKHAVTNAFDQQKTETA